MKKLIVEAFVSYKFLLPIYAAKTRYPNRPFVERELAAKLLQTIKSHYEEGGGLPLGVVVRLALQKRVKCFGMVAEMHRRYQHLSKIYASKVGGYEKLAWERTDVQQELSIKILMTVRAYARRYDEFMRTGRYKPVPIINFIQTAMNNRVKDFYKLVERVPQIDSITYASEGGNRKCDVVTNAQFEGDTIIDLSSKTLLVCGQDLLVGMNNSLHKAMFIMSVMGFKLNELDRKFKTRQFTPSTVVSAQMAFLRQDEKLLNLFKNLTFC